MLITLSEILQSSLTTLGARKFWGVIVFFPPTHAQHGEAALSLRGFVESHSLKCQADEPLRGKVGTSGGKKQNKPKKKTQMTTHNKSTKHDIV